MNANEGTFTQWIDAGYPRPQLCRNGWLSLNGSWGFAPDPMNIGVTSKWFAGGNQQEQIFESTINVPFPPGSEMSGVFQDAPESVPDVVWYSRTLSTEELEKAGDGSEILINFEAVDHIADVWVDGQHCGHHRGGYTPFSVSLGSNRTKPVLVVIRAEDSQSAHNQPRGKQAWRPTPDGIWYHRCTGIWRDVWLEAVPTAHVAGFHWETDLVKATVCGQIRFSQDAEEGSTLTAVLSRNGHQVSALTQSVCGSTANIHFTLPALLNRMDWAEWLWAPEHPNLLDLKVTLTCGNETDTVVSYVGLRSIELSNRYLNINRMPVFVRGVLDQGYWTESFFTAPSPKDIEDEIDLILSLGFNLSRVHERTPDRRYLSWADIKGLLVWGESASTYSFDEQAVLAVTREWAEIVLRDRAAPSIVTWVPFNESWGVPEIASDPRQRAFVESIVALTRSLDQTRPVSANDGWEQLETDIVTTHDYGTSKEELTVNYKNLEAVAETINGVGPQGRQTLLGSKWQDDKPVFVSEFGGISLLPSSNDTEEKTTPNWGYDVVHSPDEYEERLQDLFEALLGSPILGGFCYTQLTDTLQETNGICTADRTPKIPAERVFKVVSGTAAHRKQIRPRIVTDDATKKERQ